MAKRWVSRVSRGCVTNECRSRTPHTPISKTYLPLATAFKKNPTKTCWFYVYISLFFHAPRYLTPEVGLRPGQSYKPLLRINFCPCTRKNPGWFGKLFSITRVTTTLFIKSLLASVVVDSNIRRFKTQRQKVRAPLFLFPNTS